MKHLAGIVVCSMLAACGPDDRQPRAPSHPPQGAAASRANAEIARDFLDLSFRLESGRNLPVLTRFEGPVTLRLAPPALPDAEADLDALLQRLRAEAGIDLRRVTGPAQITVSFVPHAWIAEAIPEVACFVVPGVSDWAGYRAARGTGALDWTRLDRRDRIAVFLPADSSPQEVRDCLHEELAQALGPLNDLYRLPDSVFNDDNFHNTLTPFDMLVLRLYNSAGLHSGMSRSEVAEALPPLLREMNPGGERAIGGGHDGGLEPAAWAQAISRTVDRGKPAAKRRAAAAHALRIARAEGWTDGRLAFSLFLQARLLIGADPARAEKNLHQARDIYARLPDAAIHMAHVDMQLAALALAQDALPAAIRHADRAIPVAEAAGNAALVTTLQLLKAEALDRSGHGPEARVLRLDSRAAARYGFGSDAATDALVRDIGMIGRQGRATGAKGDH